MMGRIDMDHKNNLDTSDGNSDWASLARPDRHGRTSQSFHRPVRYLTKNFKCKTSYGSQKIN